MQKLTTWLLLQLFIFITLSYKDPRCSLPGTELEGITHPGQVMIGAVLPLCVTSGSHYASFREQPPPTLCTMFQFDYYKHLQSLIFAVEEVNKNPDILRNITLGFHWFDSCSVLSISHLATSSLLSDQIKFPSFFRTVPSDTYQSKGLAQLVLHFGWTWVGLLASDSDYGQQGIQLVKQEIIKAGACVAFTEYILLGRADRNALHIVRTIKESTAKVVVVFSSGLDLLTVLDEMLKQNVKGKTFVASEGWSTTTLEAVRKFSHLLFGTVGLAFYSGIIPGFKEFLNKVHPDNSIGGKWVKMFWEKAFSCTFTQQTNKTDSSVTSGNQCTGEESLESVQNSYNDVTNIRVAYNIYTAVHIVSQALEDLRTCNKQDKTCGNIGHFTPWQLVHYMKHVRVTLSNGRQLYFNENGDQPAVYDIINWQLGPEDTIRQMKVGSYDTTVATDEVFSLNSSILLWASGDSKVPHSACSDSCQPGFRITTRKGQPNCCYECVACPPGEISNQTDSLNCFKCLWDQWPNLQKSRCLAKDIEYLSYEEPLGATLTALSVVSSLVPILILRIFAQYKVTPIVKANNYSVSRLLLVSLVLCFLCSLAFLGYPQFQTCLLRQAAFGIVFALCISCILAKTIMVVLAFMATRPGSSLRKWTSPWVSYIIILICFLIQFILSLSCLVISPPLPEFDIRTKPGVIIVECNEGSPSAFWAMLGYLFLLATISFIVAFLARRLPNSFNEAQFITFSMLAFLSVWISYIPASLSAQGKYTVAVEIFAILASSWALVICMFFPKCFIILFRPEINSREHLMKRDRSQTKKVNK
ncbi:extracellular calcium-sensing receptor-like [Engystomops pustulosus]|uniref:extracellular calcium-sensing receptor-like n=1 Tax=Engystomops pustulosus TaxID=76066 RepID=UPI003AFAE685